MDTTTVSRSGRAAKNTAKPGRRGVSTSPRAPRRRATLCSKVTAKAQTTLPSGVRKALSLQAGDQVEYTIHGDQAVIRKAATAGELDDPAIGKFLTLLAEDIGSNHGTVRTLPDELLKRIRAATQGIAINHDAPIEGAVAL